MTRAIGFDMDYTLVIYRKELIENLAFRETIKKLIELKGYPPDIDRLEYDPRSVIRGLVVDRKLGNILKIDQFGYVCKVFHGHTKLPSQDRLQTYAGSRIRLNTDRFHSVDTLFDLPGTHLFSEMVHCLDLRAGSGQTDYWKLWEDIRDCLDKTHRDDSIKARITATPGRYVFKDRTLATTLDKFRQCGRKLFIVTNSGWDYTNRLMSFILDGEMEEYPSWTDYFDRIVVESCKPAFFTRAEPFTDLEGRFLDSDQVRLHKVVLNGNYRILERVEGAKGEEILFVGDHIYGDILRSKQSSGWRTAMIVEELEGELEASLNGGQLLTQLRELEVRGNRLDLERNITQRQIDRLAKDLKTSSEPGPHARMARETSERQLSALTDCLAKVDKKIHENDIEAERTKREYDRVFNLRWGPLFKDGNEVSRFGQQVQRFACLYTSKVSNFGSYPPNKYFRSPIGQMPHDL